MESDSQIYENIAEGKRVHFSARSKDKNDEDVMGIYFTPSELMNASPQLRQGAESRSKKKAKSRYDSLMYSLPDLPTDSTTNKPSPDASSPESPSRKGVISQSQLLL